MACRHNKRNWKLGVALAAMVIQMFWPYAAPVLAAREEKLDFDVQKTQAQELVKAKEYTDTKGKTQTIGTKLAPLKLTENPVDWVKGYRKKTTANQFQTYFKDKANSGGLLSYRYGDAWVDIAPVSFAGQAVKAQSGEVQDNHISFAKALGDNINIEYEVKETQVKEKVVISSPTSPTSPQTPLLSQGEGQAAWVSNFSADSALKIIINNSEWDKKSTVTTETRISFVKNGKTLWYWEPLVYYDAAPEAASVVGQTELSNQGNQLTVKMFVPGDWLNDSKRVYPITIDPTFTDANAKTLDAGANWWNTSYGLNKQLTVVNSSGATLNQGAVVTETIDTKALYDSGNIQNDCDDLRITYGATTQTELTRALVYPSTSSGSMTCATSTATQISFALQAAISSGSSDANYYLYYKNGSATAQATPQNAFNQGSATASLVLPLNGTTTGVGGQTPTTATGAIRYSTNSAMSFDGVNDYVGLGNVSNLKIASKTISFWANPTTSFSSITPVISFWHANWYAGFNSNGRMFASYSNAANSQRTLASGNNVVMPNSWQHFVYSFDVIDSQVIAKFYKNGELVFNQTYNDGYSTAYGSNFIIGAFSSSSLFYNGLLDEVAVYNRALTLSEVSSLYNSGAGRVVQRDANTKLILHFDENGADPRGTTTAFDDSGNGNNGAIYGSPKYVSGLVGVDPSTTLGVTSGSFASHQGVFIEEGTINLIKNPSFESNVTDSWVAKPSINFTTAQTDSDGNQLVGSNNIKDVFFYDTTKDSDGGAWRNNATAQASSWYNEAFGTTRGKKKEFPEKAYIVAEDSYVDIIDAVENKLWMRFAGSTTNMLWSNQPFLAVTALNGKVYVGTKDATPAGGVNAIDFKLDRRLLYYTSSGPWLNGGNISQRNTSQSNTAQFTGPNLVSNTGVNDVSVAVISGKTYVAVATDGGVSVINETDGTVINGTRTSKGVNVLTLAGNNLYYAYKQSSADLDSYLAVKYNIQNVSSTWDLYSDASAFYDRVGSAVGIPNATGPKVAKNTSIKISSIFVTTGTSIIDGTSNTIYVGSLGGGLSVIQEKQGDESNGSVKYYDRDKITEELVGDIRGQWGLWETTSTDANQFKASGYLDTGKLGQAVSMYGNAAGTTGSTLTFNRGTQISGNNYEHINANQGTISFWFKPSWNGNDGLSHTFFYNYVDDTHYLQIFKRASPNNYITVNFYDGTTFSQVNSTSVTISSGTFYHVVARWSRNKVDGTNTLDIRINDSTVTASSLSLTGFTSAAQNFIGSNSTGGVQAQALIDDFVIYDRVLSTTEITSLYNSGNGNEAGYVADSSLKFYAKLDGSGTLQPVTYNGGASASKMIAKSTELTGGTNLLANGNFEVASSGAPTSWTNNNSATLADAETANILFDTRSQKITVANTSQRITQDVTVSSLGNYLIEGWLRSDGTNTAQIMFYDLTNSASFGPTLTTTSSTWTKVSSAIKVPSGCTSVRVYVAPGNSASFSYYVDNITITSNLVDNGGMEGTYTATGTALYSATTAQARTGSGPYVYTETGKFATGLAGLIATDGTNFGYITASTADSVTVDFTGGSGTIATGTAFDVKGALPPDWSISISTGGYPAKETSSIHSGSSAVKLTRTTTATTLFKDFNLTAGNTYLLTFWTRGDGTNAGRYGLYDGIHASYLVPFTSTGVTGTTYTKVTKIFTTPAGFVNAQPQFATAVGASSAYFDDVSITLLDSVSTSFKSWAAVSDSSALGNSLSVQGSATGVQSLAAGVRNSAYTFDGSTGYLRQATMATNIGTLGYSGNTLSDDGQTFTSYKTSSGNAAYMIVVTNSDNTTSWGYIGNNSEAATSVTVYTTLARTTQGWNGTAVSGKTSVGYEILKTDFQITGNYTFGVWLKRNRAGILETILSKGSSSATNGGYVVYFNTDNTITWVHGGVSAMVTTDTISDSNWHNLVFVANGSNSTIYIDGNSSKSGTMAGANDNSYKLGIGGNLSASTLFQGSIDEPFVTADVLSASQILDMYNKGLGALNHATKSDQKLQGSTNTVQAVAASSDATYIYAGTDTALTVFKNGKTGNYTDSDSAVTSFTTATTPALVSNNTVALDLVGNALTSSPSLIVGSSANGVSGVNLVRGVPALDTTTPRFGSKALLLDNTNSVLDTPFVMQDTRTAASYTMSFYAYSTGTQLTSVDILPYVNNAPITGATYEDVGGGWTRVQTTFTGDTVATRSFGMQVKAGKKIYVDGVQLENKAYVSSYADGSMGTGYSWTTANNSVTTRTKAVLAYPASGNISGSTGSISFWSKRSNPLSTASQMYLDISADNTDAWSVRRIQWQRNQVVMTNPGKTNGVALGFTISDSNWHHLALTWTTGPLATLYVDGVSQGSTSNINLEDFGTANLYIGSHISGFYQMNNTFSDFRVLNQALSQNQVSDLYYAGLAGHSEGTATAAFTPTKTHESATLDAGDIANWNSLSWTQTLPATVSSNPILFKFAVKDTDSGWSDSDFLGSDCTTGTYWSDLTNPYSVNLAGCSAFAPSTSSAKRYARYRTYLQTADTTVTPSVDSVTVNYSLADTTAPTISLNAVPTGTTNQQLPITGSATDNLDLVTAVEQQIDGGSWSACSGTMNINPATFSCTPGSALAEGQHSVNIRASDNHGNTTASGSYATATYYVDLSAPTTPSTPATTNPTNSTSQTWTWSASDAVSGIASYLWRVTDAVGTAVTSGTSTVAHVVTNLLQGVWRMFVTAVDYAGNQSSESAAGSVTVDTTSPTTTDAGIDGNWHSTVQTVVLTCVDSGGTDCTTIYHTTDGTDPTTGSTTGTTFALDIEGTYTIKYFGRDTAGNNESVKTASHQVKIDKSGPTTPGVPAVATSPTAEAKPTWTWTGAADYLSGVATYTILLSQDAGFGSGVVTATTASNSYTPASNLADGRWYAKVMATDQVGNVSAYSAAGSAVIDATGPGTPGTPATSTPTNDTTPTWTWTAASDAGVGLSGTPYTFQWSTDAGFGSSVNTVTTANSYYTIGAVADGTWYARVRATDSLGNNSGWSGTGTVVVATGAPSGSVSLNGGAAYSNSTAVSATLSASGGVGIAQMKVAASSDLSGIAWETYATSKNITLSTGDGSKTVYAQFKDTAGNESAITSDSIFLDTAAPTAPGLTSPGDVGYVNSTRPTFGWNISTDGSSGINRYRLATDKWAIENIPPSSYGDIEVDKYHVHYGSGTIEVYTKSSGFWGSGENNGQMDEGRVSWNVTAYDNAGNSQGSGRAFYVDLGAPTLSGMAIKAEDILGEKDGYQVSTNQLIGWTGKVSDNYAPDKLEMYFYKQNYFLGMETSRTLEFSDSVQLHNDSNATEVTFNYTPSRRVDYGKYLVSARGVDKAGNKSAQVNFSIWLAADAQAREILTKTETGEKKEDIITKIQEASPVSLPELEKQAVLVRQKQADELTKFTGAINDFLTTALRGIGTGLAKIVTNVTLALGHTSQWLAGAGRNMAGVVQRAMLNVQDSRIKVQRAFAMNVQDSRIKVQRAFAMNVQDSRIKVQDTMGNVQRWLAGVGQGINEGITNGVTAMARVIPGVVRQGMAILIVKPFTAANYQLARTEAVVGKNIARTWQAAGEQTGETVQSVGNWVVGIQISWNKSEDNVSKGIVSAQKDTWKSIQDVGIGMRRVTAGTQTSINNGVNEFGLAVASRHEEINKMISGRLAQIREGAGYTVHSLVDPAEKGRNFVARVAKGIKIALVTFESFVFDDQPTRISNVAMTEVGKDYAVVNWTTNHYTKNNKVNFGVNTSYGREAWGENGTKEHQVKISGLEPGQKYYFEVMSQNKNYAYDAFYTFETTK